MRKSATKKELAADYNVHPQTFSKWLKNIPNLNLKPDQRILTPKQVKLIYEHLG